LAQIDERIPAITIELQQPTPPPETSPGPGGVVTPDLGEGPERFLLGLVDEGSPELQVLTPNSALGRAVHGAQSGGLITYDVAGQTRIATVVPTPDLLTTRDTPQPGSLGRGEDTP
jgi:hypothetical protein